MAMKLYAKEPPDTRGKWAGALKKVAVTRQTICVGCLAQIDRLYQSYDHITRADAQRKMKAIEARMRLPAEAIARGDWWCVACKDPEGYIERLRVAQAEAHQLCLEAYPVCKHCGMTLPQAFIEEGRNTHAHSSMACA